MNLLVTYIRLLFNGLCNYERACFGTIYMLLITAIYRIRNNLQNHFVPDKPYQNLPK